jgi:hypothetical protein
VNTVPGLLTHGIELVGVSVGAAVGAVGIAVGVEVDRVGAAERGEAVGDAEIGEAVGDAAPLHSSQVNGHRRRMSPLAESQFKPY